MKKGNDKKKMSKVSKYIAFGVFVIIVITCGLVMMDATPQKGSLSYVDFMSDLDAG